MDMDRLTEPQIVDVAPATTAVIRGVVPMAELPAFFDRAFVELPAVLAAQGIAPTGVPFALYRQPPGETADLELGLATERPVEPTGDVVPAALPGGRIARLVHEGGYDGLGESWGRLQVWLTEQGHQPGSVMWEVYLTEPGPEVDPSTLRTELNLPIAS